MSGYSDGLSQFKLNYQISPIILNNGVAANMPGGAIPIISITQAQDFDLGVLDGGTNIPLDKYFANFQVIPGGTIIDQQLGRYPFANQAVAANAVISQPLKVALLMICPVQEEGGYASKTSIMQSLKSTIEQHNRTGGTYTVMTPNAIYTDCILISLTDVGGNDTKQVQAAWRWDFEQPLLTQAAAEQAYNSSMGRIARRTQTTGQLSGFENAVDAPFGAQMPSIIPAGKIPVGSSTGRSNFIPNIPNI